MNASKARKTILAKIAVLQADLAALDRLEAEYGPHAQGLIVKRTDSSKSGTDLNFPENNGFKLIDAAHAVIESHGFHETFTKNHILKTLREKYPTIEIKDASVASLLWKLAAAGELEVVEKGTGKTPSKYKQLISLDFSDDADLTDTLSVHPDRQKVTGGA